MSPKDGLPQQYNASMAYYKLGYAFYDPESSYTVKPGACGYIDGTGYFHRIVNVNSTKATKKTIDHTNIGLTAGASGLPAGVPVDATGMIEFTLKSDFGAVLLCDGEVSKQGFEHADPFRQWARANAAKLLEKFPTVRDHGFYVVLTTFTTRAAFMNGWHNSSHKVTLGFKGAVDPVANVSSSTEFYGADSAGGWTRAICDDAKEEKVVFFSGLKYEYNKLTGWMRNSKFSEVPLEKWRGDNLIVPDPDNKDDAIEISELKVGEKTEE